jgi:lysine-specific demethylase 8
LGSRWHVSGCITHWPALLRWKDVNYLKKVAGARTVPIELGAHYVHPTWSQKLMTVGEFIEAHVEPQIEENIPVGYLAQHPLFDQVCILASLTNLSHIVKSMKFQSAK